MSLHSNSSKELPSLLQHMCHLDFVHESNYRRMVGIIATIGVSSRSVDVIYELIKTGVNIVRVNFAHETEVEHTTTVNNIRQAVDRYSKELGYNYPVAIAGDLKGRVIRTGIFATVKFVELQRGDYLKLSINEIMYNKCTKEAVYIDYAGIIKEVDVGQRIFIDDSAIEVEVREVGVDMLLCQVRLGGLLRNRVSVVVPGVALNLPVISDKDEDDIKFCADNNFDYVLVSKLRTANDVEAVRRRIGSYRKRIKIITKVENTQALENLDDILKVSDGILFARADMSIDLKVHKIFLAQKAVLARCNRLGKPVVCGTQLLMSMGHSATPTRSDVSDIGTALLDGADCLLLSSETAIGLYPVEAVRILALTLREAEAAIWYRKLFLDLLAHNPSATNGAHAVAINAVTTSINVLATGIIVTTLSGKSAELVSMYRPRCPVFAVTRCHRVARQLNHCRGIIPIVVPANNEKNRMRDVEAQVNYTLNIGNRMGIVQSGDAVVILSPQKQPYGFVNNVHVIYANFEKPSIDYKLEKYKSEL